MNAFSGSVTAVILAGGAGARVRHLHPDLPKPMIEVRGQPFLVWVIRHLRRLGVTRVLISTGYKSEIIERHFADRPIQNVTVLCVREERPFGTAGGFLNAVKSEPTRPAAWLVLNGDSLAPADLSHAFAVLADSRCDGVLIGVAEGDAARYGTLTLDESGRLLGFNEKRPGAGVISAGIYLLKPGLLANFPRTLPLSFERQVFPHLLDCGARLQVSLTKSPFLDIGTPESLARAGMFIDKNLGSLQPA